jgi:glycosyltransferase involved in cell wall biosynthesis
MKISVIIPVYNAEKYLTEAVLSALKQKETGEVLLIEDSSTDKSLIICKKLEKKYSNVKLILPKNKKNRGAGFSRNLGINNSKYDYLAFLDADDFYLPNRFIVSADILRKEENIDGVFEAVGKFFQDKDAEKKWNKKRRTSLSSIPKIKKPEKLFEIIFKEKKGFYHLNGLVVKKRIFKKCGYFFENLELHQDTAMFAQMSLYGNLTSGRINKPVAMRRIHDKNRIIQTKDFYKSRLLLWKTLFYWAKERNLDFSRLQIIFQHYAISFIEVFRAKKQTTIQNLKILKLMAIDFIKQPLLVTYSIFQILILKFNRKIY